MLAEVSDGPAPMAGFGMGAAIGIQVLARHLGMLCTLVADPTVHPCRWARARGW
ncbi:hypothetical protein ACIF8W_32205 [Streptomyces sp. NPDC085639]|uniref:hypothetical protein n=1 Tax=Streptomyces sp. NPDC085639 TaxID=3365734 RepID=UPI0037CF2468